MKLLKAAAIAVMLASAGGATAAMADSISSVEGARAKERAGYRLTGQDRDDLRKYGSNDDWGYRGYGYRGYGYRDYGYYDDGPSVSVYVGPRRYYGPYDY